jgi:outer membrane receptor protein involved in Fe transport
MHVVNEPCVSKRVAISFSGSVTVLAMVLFGWVEAPASANAADVAAEEAGASQGLAEIVVTANKREQNLNDVGLAVAVLGGNEMKDQGISSLADIAQSVPGLSFTPTPTSTPVYTLRGIGFYETSLGAYPTVPVYIDEFPLSFPATTSHSAFDLERVEVLKGPQGTLFGQNATGGAINLIAAKPTREFQAGNQFTYGRFNEVDDEAFVSGSLSDTLTARVAVRYERADGWQISNTRPDDTNGKKNNLMGRMLLEYRPNDTLRLQLDINGWHDGGQTEAPQYVALIPQQTPPPNVANAAFSPLTPRAADWTPGLPFKDDRMGQVALRGDVNITDSITLTSLTSFVAYHQDQRDDADGLPAITLDLATEKGDIRSVAQELRLSNGGKDALRWVVGGNYEHSTVNQTVNDIFPDSSTAYIFVPLGYPHFYIVDQSSDQKITNKAVFVNTEYDLSKPLTVNAGVRYTQSNRDGKLCSSDPGPQPGVGAFFYNILYGGALGPYAGQCYVLNDTSTPINGVPPGSPGPYAGSLDESNVSWRTGLNWKPTPGLLVYGNVAKGYKAGSFPTVSATTFTQFFPVKQESVLTYEAGFKSTLFNQALQLNGAVFYDDYKNKQLRSKLNAPPFGILDVLQNIPKSTVKGAELEVTARPLAGLTASLSFTYIDAKIDRFTGINGAGVAANFAGERFPFTPKYEAALNSEYRFGLTSSLQGFVGGTVSYRSNTVAVVGGDIAPPYTKSEVANPLLIDAYTLVDLRAGVATADDKLRVSLWGKNVFNSYYWSNVVTAFDTIARYPGMPVTYGVTVGYRY